MLLLSFLLLIPRICISWAAEQGTDSRAKVFGYCFMELMKSANHKHKQLQCYCRTVWAPAFSFLLKCYYIYCQHRGNAMLSSLFHGYAFAPLAAVPLSRLSCRIPYSMGYESQQQKTGALQLFQWSWRVLGKECPCSQSPQHRGCFLCWFLDQQKLCR